MTHDANYKLVNEFMGIVQRRDSDRMAMRWSREPSLWPRRFLDIVLSSSLTSLLLLACFFAGWNFDTIKARFLPPPVDLALAATSEVSLADPRRELQDNELLTTGLQRQLKGSLQFTIIASTPSEEPVEMGAGTSADTPPEEIATADGSGLEQDQGDGAGEMTVGPEDPAAQLTRSPVLRKAQTSGDVEIGSFTTVSLPGSSGECLDTAYGLLEDAGASRDKLKVLAESGLITVARICASNGSLVVTCRSDQITISPRRLKPNESCTG